MPGEIEGAMTRTFSLLALLSTLAVILLVGPAGASAATCETSLLALGTTLPGDNFQGQDGDQCSPADAGLGGVDATDWHDIASTPGALSGDNGAVLTDNVTADPISNLNSLGSDPSVFGCQTAAPKEETPGGWCYSPSSLQDKSNVITAWLNKRVFNNKATGVPE